MTQAPDELSTANEDPVSLETFRHFCSQELDSALATGDARQHESFAQYETPSGMDITRYAGGALVVELVEYDTASGTSTTTEFDWRVEPPMITQDTRGGGRPKNITVKRRDHDAFARQYIKFVTLIP